LPVERTTVTFVDGSRPTEDPDQGRSAPTRTLVTDLYVPEGEGPFPLIVHAHGAGGHPRKFTQLLGAWAQHGYVVVAPAFPLTNDRSGGSDVIGDYTRQPGDLRFVLDEVLAMADRDGTAVSGKIATDHIGASGLSLGGATTYGFAFNSCCRDDRIDAVIIMAGIRLPFEGTFDMTDMPLLVTHGTVDVLPVENAREAYAEATAPKYFVSLVGGLHAPPYEDTPSPHDELVTDLTTDFWDAYLRADDDAATRVVEDATGTDLAELDYETASRAGD
jgi:dienelactone hydrolase